MPPITRATPTTTWKAQADVPARRKTRYSAKDDKLVVTHEDPAFVGTFDLTIDFSWLLKQLAEKAARSKGGKTQTLSGAITLKFKGETK